MLKVSLLLFESKLVTVKRYIGSFFESKWMAKKKHEYTYIHCLNTEIYGLENI